LRIAVTGGAGFLGSHLVDALMRSDENRVVVIDDLSAGTFENVAAHVGNERFRFVTGDVRDYDLVAGILAECDLAFHLAAQCLPISIFDPFRVHDVNATGTLTVCQAALKAGLQRLVHIASAENYGSARYVPMDENHPFDPTTPYGASKVAGELYARSFVKTHGLRAIVVRPFNSYGPRLPYEGPYGNVIPKFVVRVLAGQPPIIYGDGCQTRDFTFVEDTVAGILAASRCDELIGDAVNIASGRETSINEISDVVLDVLGSRDLEPRHVESRPGDVRRHFAAIEKARRMLGYEPRTSIREGVERYAAWIKAIGLDPETTLRADWEKTWSRDGARDRSSSPAAAASSDVI
jgi:UDP-glucose 4-epimerase